MEVHMSLRRLIPALTLTVVAGCAHIPGKAAGKVPVTVDVKNDFADGIGYSIYLVTLPQDRRRLGDVAPRKTKTFSFKPSGYTLQYQLVATAPLKRTISSAVFTLVDERTIGIGWDLDSNLLELLEAEESDAKK
jgi:hypothetical protein